MTSAPSTAPAGSRIAALDGLRGITIILVVLGHVSSYLWPIEGLRSTPYLRGLIGGGAVTIFFIISGYIVTSGLLREQATGVLDPVRFLARRLVRVGAQIVPLCAVILVISLVDTTDKDSLDTTTRTISNTLTYTHNLLYQQNPLGARADMGHLWFLSIQQQWYLVLPLVVLLLAGRRAAFAALVTVAAVSSTIYRVSTVSDDTWFDLAINTFARADALLLGVLLAVALPWLSRWATHAPIVGWGAATALLALLLVSKEGDPLAFLQGWGVAFTVVATVLIACVALHDRTSLLTMALGTRWLAWLGQASLVIYVWHFPLIFWLSRQTTSWTWIPQMITFVAILAVITAVANRWIEGPVRIWLATHLRPYKEVRPVPVADVGGVRS